MSYEGGYRFITKNCKAGLHNDCRMDQCMCSHHRDAQSRFGILDQRKIGGVFQQDLHNVDIGRQFWTDF